MFRKSWSFARFAVFCISSSIYLFELCVKYDVSTFIDYSFVRLMLYLLFGLCCMFGHCRRMMYDVLYMTFRLMRCLFSFNYS